MQLLGEKERELYLHYFFHLLRFNLLENEGANADTVFNAVTTPL